MQAKRLPQNGTIGIFSPSHVAEMERYRPIISGIERLGFKVKLGDNFTKDTYGYAASAEERADDLNSLVTDNDVQLILFSGGDSAAEILPLINYENIRRNPKLFSSYSDGTSILNAIYAKTELITYYGFGAGQLLDLRHYDYTQFCSHFIEGYSVKYFESDSEWKIICAGNCEGLLIGGYSSLFTLMLCNEHFSYNKNKKYILFLEDNEKFSKVSAVSTYLAFISQNAFIRNVTGLIFGHYSDNMPDSLFRCLERFGKNHNIPVVYTNDFGHGTKHAVLPIGINAKLETDQQSLNFYNT